MERSYKVLAGIYLLLFTSTLVLAGPNAGRALASDFGMLLVARSLMSASSEQVVLAQTANDWFDRAYPGRCGQFRDGDRRKGLAYLIAGQSEQAIECLVSASQDGQNPIASYWLGMAYEQSGNHEQAINAWVSVNFQQKVFERADAFLRDGQLDQAKREYSLILAASPDNARALLGLGRIAAYRSNWAEADRMFAKVMEISPNNVEVLVELGTVRYLGQRQPDEAFALYARAIRLSPQCYWCYLVYSGRLIDARQFDSAAAVLTDATLHAAGQDSLVYRRLAQLYLEQLDQPAKAREVCQQGLRQFSEDSYLYYYLGLAEAKLTNLAAARQALGRSVELAPQVEEFREALRRLH